MVSKIADCTQFFIMVNLVVGSPIVVLVRSLCEVLLQRGKGGRALTIVAKTCCSCLLRNHRHHQYSLGSFCRGTNGQTLGNVSNQPLRFG